ncbi:MAG: putative TetR family transcriptional regulator [Marmoricola sp.]|nr:putative TetR family transcriptional regulator [Marmoricola sp.]
MAYVKAAEREQQIVASALQVLSNVGVPNTTLRMVAAEAGIPLGTLHYVFPSKDLLLRAVINAVLDGVTASFQMSIELDQGLEHALRTGVENLWTEIVENKLGLQIMQYELALYSSRATDDRELARIALDRYADLLSDLCEKAASAAGETCAIDFATLGRLLLGTLDGMILQLVAGGDRGRTRADLEHVIAMLVQYAAPAPRGP